MRVYILLTQTTSVLTRMIRLYTKKPYNHASLAFDERLEYTYSFGRVNPNDPLIGGFSHERLNDGVFKDATCQLLSLDVTPEQYQLMRQRVSNMEENQLKYKFNFIGLFGTKFNFDLGREYAFFCSQFVSKVLQEVGLFPEDFPPHLVKPTDLVDHLNLKIEYQGPLAEYLQSAGFKALNEGPTPVTLRRKLFYMPFRMLIVPFKVVSVGTSTLKTSRKYLTSSKRIISERIFQEQKSS